MVVQRLTQSIKMENSFITNIGNRKSNQDVISINRLEKGAKLYLLADGMGGYKDGEFAANFIVSKLVQVFNKVVLFDEKEIQNAIDEVTKSLAYQNDIRESKM